MAQVSQHFTFLAFSLRLLGLAYLVIIVSAHLFPSFNIQKIANLASQNILSACSSVLKGAWDKFMLKRDLAKEPSGFRRLQAWRPPSIPIWLIQIADSSKGRVLHKKNSTCGYARLVHVYYHKKALGFYLGPLLLDASLFTISRSNVLFPLANALWQSAKPLQSRILWTK